MDSITIHVDGATGGVARVGVAAVARSGKGHFVAWESRQLARMTNNEAEYQAALLGLAMAAALGARRVEIVTDSDVVVKQMAGHSRVLSKRLQALHRETVDAVGRFQAVSFRHVPREQNRLADALAAEALAGRTVRMPGKSPHAKIAKDAKGAKDFF